MRTALIFCSRTGTKTSTILKQVIAHKAAYVVAVEKDGVAGLIADDDDPRA